MTPDQVAKLCAENLRMRDKLLELAKECSDCDGTGIINVGRPPILDDCPHCNDIRELLA